MIHFILHRRDIPSQLFPFLLSLFEFNEPHDTPCLRAALVALAGLIPFTFNALKLCELLKP
jgi:hypothetical protein